MRALGFEGHTQPRAIGARMCSYVGLERSLSIRHAGGQGLHRSVPLGVESPHNVQCQGPGERGKRGDGDGGRDSGGGEIR